MKSITSTAPIICSVCHYDGIDSLGDKEFSISGNDLFLGHRTFEDTGVRIPYFRCCQCGFTFTNAFDSWADEDFRTHIYNGEYLKADPPFAGERARRNAAMVAALWHRDGQTMSFLDFGGGDGLLSEELRKTGFRAETFDKYHLNSVPPDATFDVITCFEVIEHVKTSEQFEFMRTLVGFMRPGARILLSTELREAATTVEDWYLCPRNGHISIHSDNSLRRLGGALGLSLVSLSSEMHILY